MPIVDNLIHLLGAGGEAFSQAHDLNLGVAIFLNRQLLLTVQQIDHFATVNLEETHIELHISRRQLKHLFDGLLGRRRDGERLPRARLSIGKQSHDTSRKERRNQVLYLVLVERPRVLLL